MKYKDQPVEVKQIILDMAKECGYGHPEYSNLEEIDYKFWEDVDHESNVIDLAQKLAKSRSVIKTLLDKIEFCEKNRRLR
jgi:hypothetical protein